MFDKESPFKFGGRPTHSSPRNQEHLWEGRERSEGEEHKKLVWQYITFHGLRISTTFGPCQIHGNRVHVTFGNSLDSK